MDGLRDPIGGKPSEIYWRRRIVAAIGVVLVFVVIFFLATSPSGDGKKASAVKTTVTPPVTSADPSAPPSGDVSRPCTTADVQLMMAANPKDFAAGALPVFNVDIKQSGATPCRLDTAAAGTELKITSGKDRIFSSLDCPADATINARQFLLQPGASETFQVTWNRTRSAPECAAVSAAPRAGTYHAVLTVQGIEGNDTTFSLTD